MTDGRSSATQAFLASLRARLRACQRAMSQAQGPLVLPPAALLIVLDGAIVQRRGRPVLDHLFFFQRPCPRLGPSRARRTGRARGASGAARLVGHPSPFDRRLGPESCAERGAGDPKFNSSL